MTLRNVILSQDLVPLLTAPPTLAAPADLIAGWNNQRFNFPRAVPTSVIRQEPNGYDFGAEDDFVVLQRVRIWSNFAGGLVFTDSLNPTIKLWQGDSEIDGQNSPDYIQFNPCELNTWFPVGVQLPRFESELGIYGGVAGTIDGAQFFKTKSINTAFNGSTVQFVLQVEVSCGLW